MSEMSEADQRRMFLLAIKRGAQETIDRCDVMLGTPEDGIELAPVTGPDDDGYLRHRCKDGFRIYGAADRSWWRFELIDDSGELNVCPTCGRRLRMSVEVRR